jgi:DNA uptake protein ComE-like DNA-binding protein
MTTPILPTALLGAAALVVALAGCGGDASDTADSVGAAPSTIAPAPGPTDTGAATAAAADTGMLDPDSASRDQLATVPGMTAAAADALVAGRPYADMGAVDRALSPHLGEPARDSVYARVWKPIDLNTASDAEIQLIPGVGARMLREFKEYRPYDGIEKFRREIGKYVDEAEVARLERYVMIRPGAR